MKLKRNKDMNDMLDKNVLRAIRRLSERIQNCRDAEAACMFALDADLHYLNKHDREVMRLDAQRSADSWAAQRYTLIEAIAEIVVAQPGRKIGQSAAWETALGY